MDANKIIDNLVNRIAILTKENAFLAAQLEDAQEKLKEKEQESEVEQNG